ncbi:MAG: DUF1501 domain-containing protein [Pirellulales bacterium]
MPHSSPPHARSCFPSVLPSRREALRAGGLAVAGLSLPRLLAAERAASERGASPPADACIVILLNGGPSHLDMWDMKPAAPDGIRGEFKPIATSAPGIQFSEHLPKLAKQAHHTTLVRSMQHGVNDAHALAVYTALTGHDRGDANRIVGASAEDHPSAGSLLSRLRPPERNIVPYVALPYKTKEGASGPPQPGFFGGWLGQSYDPLWVLNDPNAKEFAVPELTLPFDVSPERLAARGGLLDAFNRRLGEAAADGMTRFQHRAADLLTSEDTRRAFRVAEEPDAVREAYGRNIYGQSVLLARRLIEAGTRMVTVSWAPDANATWDTHGGNFKKLKGTLLPQFDAACSTLLSDLDDRGLLRRTLVVVTGDFGRSPKINSNDGGRDHWNYCYTIMLAGGGLRSGYVHGASDSTGAFPATTPVSPGDIQATLYRQLGLDPHGTEYDSFGRPHRLVPAGEVVGDLLA